MRVIEETCQVLTNIEAFKILEKDPNALKIFQSGTKDEIRAMTSVQNGIAFLQDDTYSLTWPSVEALHSCLEELSGRFGLSQKDLMQVANVAPQNLPQFCLCIEAHAERFTIDQLSDMLDLCTARYVYDDEVGVGGAGENAGGEKGDEGYEGGAGDDEEDFEAGEGAVETLPFIGDSDNNGDNNIASKGGQKEAGMEETEDDDWDGADEPISSLVFDPTQAF